MATMSSSLQSFLDGLNAEAQKMLNGIRLHVPHLTSVALRLALSLSLVLYSSSDLAFGASVPNSGQTRQSSSLVTAGRGSSELQRTRTLHDYQIIGANWRTDGSFVSTIRITNTLSDVPLRATPVLFMADGTEYSLPAIDIPAAGVVNIRVNDAIEKAPPSIRDHRSTFGSAAIRYRWVWQAALSGTVLAVDVKHSLTFTTAFVFPSSDTAIGEQTSEGIYWLPFDQSRAFLTLYNASRSIITAQLSTFDSAGKLISLSEHVIEPNSTERAVLNVASRNLPGRQPVGGVRVSYAGTNRSLIVNGGIEDYQHGFSLSLASIRPMAMGETVPTQYSIASSGLMAGTQDPMMGFPVGTTFKPFAILRNISMESITVTPVLETANRSNNTEIRGKTIALLPNETVHLDFRNLTDHVGAHSSMLNVLFDVVGPQTALLVSTGSIDQTVNYVFEVEPQSVSTTETKQVPYWSTAEGYDTMITVWNPTSSEQQGET